MPVPVTEADSFPSSLDVPSDGEDANQAGVLGTFLQDLSNRSRWLYNRSPGGGALLVPLVPLINTSSRFTFNIAAGCWRQDDVTDQGEMIFTLPYPPPEYGFTVDKFTAYVDGGQGGGHSTIPSTGGALPQLGVIRTGAGNAVEGDVLASVVDPSTTPGEYDILHVIETASLSSDPDASGAVVTNYYISFKGEAGPNAVASTTILKGIVATLIRAT